MERDPVATGLRSALGTATAHDAVRELVERALRGHDSRLATIVRRCDADGEPTDVVAREIYVSVRHFFRYRAAAVEAIAVELDRLTPAERTSARDSRSEEARRAYGYARHLMARADAGDQRVALRWLERAVAVDANYVDALLAISRAQLALVLSSETDDPATALARATDAVTRASGVRGPRADVLAEKSALALWTDASPQMVRSMAEAELALDARCARAHYAVGWTAAFADDYATARARMSDAAAADPQNLSYLSVAMALPFFERNFAETAARARELQEIEPCDPYTLAYLAEALNAQGRWSETIAALTPVVVAGRVQHAALAAYVRALALTGDLESARRFETSFIGPSVERAAIRMAFGDVGGAFALLDVARAERNGMIHLVRCDPVFDELHDQARFRALTQPAA